MTNRFGAFGKMPALGDFFRIDLLQGFVDPWDRWLQEAILTARGQLGGRWQDCYFSAPIWRFTLAPGILGAAGVTGVMMMSVDRVGRQFPLTLAAPLPEGGGSAADHLAQGATFAALEAVALDALEDTMTREVLAERLAQIAPAHTGTAGQATVLRQPAGLVVHARGDLGTAMAAATVAAGFRRPSFWSAALPGATRLMVCEGLPAGGQVLGLFDLHAAVWGLPPPDLPAPAMDDALPAPLEPTLPPRGTAPAVVPRPAAPAAPPRSFGPDDDPLADILLDDPPDTPGDADSAEDALAAILSAGDTPPDDAAAAAPGPVQGVP